MICSMISIGIAGLDASITVDVVGIVSVRIKVVSISWKAWRDDGGKLGAGSDDDRKGYQVAQTPNAEMRD